MGDNETAKTVERTPNTSQTAIGDERVKNAEPAPQDVDGLVLRAATAHTREEMLTDLSRAVELDPGHAVARQALYRTLKLQLDEDAFLAYLSEDERLYQVRTGADVPVQVPKERAVVPPYPPPQPGPLYPALRWLRLALIGLLPSGLGTLLFAPATLYALMNVHGSSLSKQDRNRRFIFAVVALGLWFLGLFLGAFAFIHL